MLPGGARMTQAQTVLSIRGAEHRYRADHAALAGADLDLRAGHITALLGPSGSGKSTLLRAIAGLERLDAGSIRLGETIWDDKQIHLPPEARRVGMVFQDYALFPHMTALANVAFGLSGADKKAHALAQLEVAELGHRAKAYPHELSGGEQQRVALARALAPHPAVVLLDEPFSGLDRRLRGELRERTVDTLRAARTTALIVTHDAEEAMAVADELAFVLTPAENGAFTMTRHRSAGPHLTYRFSGEMGEWTAQAPSPISIITGDRVNVALDPVYVRVVAV